MQAHAGDAGVFIRSMATRGHLGGLAPRDRRRGVVLDAAGKDIVLIETVGVGQDEVEIVRTADVSVVDARAGHGRRGAGAQGRHHGDRRHLRGEQGGSRGRRPDCARRSRRMLSLQTLRRRRLAAADCEDGGDHRRWRARAGGGDRTFRAHAGAARAPPARLAPSSACATARAAVHAARRTARARARASSTRCWTDRRARARSVRGAGSSTAPWRPQRRRDRMKAVARSRRHRGCRTSTDALAFYRDALGLEVEAPEEVAVAARSRAFRSFSPPAASRWNCWRHGDDSPIARYIAKRGPGLHHITLRVDDIVAALAQLKRARRAPDRRGSRVRAPRCARRVHPSVERARRARRAEAGAGRREQLACTPGELS